MGLRKRKREEAIRALTARFSQMFPEAPKGQGRFIAEDAYDNGRCVHDSYLPITDKVFLMTISFLRHQFYYKLHYGHTEKRREANRKAIEIMREWGYGRKDRVRKTLVPCPKCYGQMDSCSLCYGKGEVVQWAAWNYELIVRLQQEE